MGLRDRLDRAASPPEENGGAEVATAEAAPPTALHLAVYQRIKQTLQRKLIEHLAADRGGAVRVAR
jgi:hypothetical protein